MVRAIVAPGLFRVRRQLGGGHTDAFSGKESMRVQKSRKKGCGNVRVVARKAVAKLPKATVRGFHDGRKAGNDFVENAPYFAGHSIPEDSAT
jgi:hypothetical protein